MRHGHHHSRILLIVLLMVSSSIAVAALHVSPARSEPVERRNLGDADIEGALETRLVRDDLLPADFLDITVEQGVVTLTGTVRTLRERDRALAVAKALRGVRAVVDRLRVQPVSRSDAAIAADVVAALEADAATDAYEVEVGVQDVAVIDGTVYLTGRVDSVPEKRRADEVAGGVNGVVAVVNDLTVRSWPWNRGDDLALRQQILEQLWWSPFVDSDRVHVSVQDGVATLTGTVRSWHERRTAEENAREGGAAMVRNRLEVEGTPETSRITPNGEDTAS